MQPDTGADASAATPKGALARQAEGTDDGADGGEAQGRATSEDGAAVSAPAATVGAVAERPEPEAAVAGDDARGERTGGGEAAGPDSVALGEAGHDDVQGAAPTQPLVRDFLLNPSRWGVWPAVALLRWVMNNTSSSRRLVYRSRPTLSFSSSEVHEIGMTEDAFHLVLAAPGLAAPGSALPLSDVARIVADGERQGGGALAYWLDGLVDRLMQAVEVAEAHSNAAFALATGGELRVVESVLNLAGLSAPLQAEPGGVLRDSLVQERGVPVPGLGRMFVGPATAAGLEALVSGFTGLPARVDEFVPVAVPVAQPVRVGAALGGQAIGLEGEVPAAGVNVQLDGRDDPDAVVWVRDADRSRALASLCEAYVGGPSPRVFLFADIPGEHLPPATLDGETAFGRAAVLGQVDAVMRVPIDPGDVPDAT